jgi:hypothetical protein
MMKQAITARHRAQDPTIPPERSRHPAFDVGRESPQVGRLPPGLPVARHGRRGAAARARFLEPSARVAKLVDAWDLKSFGPRAVWVRIPPRAFVTAVTHRAARSSYL